MEYDTLVGSSTQQLQVSLSLGEGNRRDGCRVIGERLDGLVVLLRVGEDVDHPITTSSGQKLHTCVWGWGVGLVSETSDLILLGHTINIIRIGQVQDF